MFSVHLINDSGTMRKIKLISASEILTWLNIKDLTEVHMSTGTSVGENVITFLDVLQ
jgi:hypothetical protein